jgi:hemerythrin-like domain-containing protein
MMSAIPQQGWALTRLLQLHEGIRADIELLRRASADLEAGDDRRALADLQRLSARTPVWTLQTFCVAFCDFVHAHHSTEDTLMFPMLLHHADGHVADLTQVIDELKAEHRALAGYLDQAQQAVAALPGDAAARFAAVHAVQDVTRHLVAHLDEEEQQLGPALNVLSGVVPEHEVPPPPPEHLHGVSGNPG